MYRLLKVVCQASLVTEDDDGNLTEHVTEPITVSAKDWPGFPKQLMIRIAAMNNGQAVPADFDPMDGPASGSMERSHRVA